MTTPGPIAAERLAAWWSIGFVIAGIAPIAAIWTVNRDGEFWLGVLVVAVVGLVVGVGRIPDRLPWPGSVLFAAAYPISIASAVSLEAVETNGDFGFGAAIGWTVAITVGALPLIGAARTQLVWFRWWTVAWGLVSAALFFAYGLGLVFVPLAVSAALSQRRYRSAAR